jgi:hypothetical protein
VGRIHYAKLANSPRLQRAYNLLQTKNVYTGKELENGANVSNAHTIKAELLCNGVHVKNETLRINDDRTRVVGYWIPVKCAQCGASVNHDGWCVIGCDNDKFEKYFKPEKLVA